MEPLSDQPEDQVGFELASLGARFGSRLIDIIIYLAIAFVTTGIFDAAGWIDIDEAVETGTTDTNVAFSLVVLGVYALYEVGMIATRGQTVGKIATRSKVITVDGDDPPGWNAALLRTGAAWLPILIPAFGLLVMAAVFIWATWDSNRQGLHDKAASTYVVKAGPRGA